MTLERVIGWCLVSQEIRERIHAHQIIVPDFDERRIQPASFEPTLGDEGFVLGTETRGLFRPEQHTTVYRRLLELPASQRKEFSLVGGYELRKGFTYLIPLRERLSVSDLACIRSSPKSSAGRVFLDTRMVTDYHSRYDEIGHRSGLPELLDSWLLIQPLVFNVLAFPGISLNQLRFLTGLDALLGPAENSEEWKRQPFLFQDAEGNTPVEPTFTSDGLEIHLSLLGKTTHNVIGLRACPNPMPIDLRATAQHRAEDYFQPWMADQEMHKGEYYLFSTAEHLRIPPHINIELSQMSGASFRGMLHFAGFIDPGFQGDLVLEARSDELTDIVLQQGMPLGTLKLFRNIQPDKLYGGESHSHYQRQTGPRTAKFFQPFDFATATKNYAKLDRDVLVQDARLLRRHRALNEGFELVGGNIDALLEDIQTGFFSSRYDCEHDRRVLQPIPYVLLFGPDSTVFSYVRSSKIEDYGDVRLFGKHSVGVGGHIIRADRPHYVVSGLEREVFQEELDVRGWHSEPRLVGTLFSTEKPVDEVHFGLVYAVHIKKCPGRREKALVSGGMRNIEKIGCDPLVNQRYETWSKLLIPHLHDIYNQTKP